jgi:hypothetical protein
MIVPHAARQLGVQRARSVSRIFPRAARVFAPCGNGEPARRRQRCAGTDPARPTRPWLIISTPLPRGEDGSQLILSRRVHPSGPRWEPSRVAAGFAAGFCQFCRASSVRRWAAFAGL